MPKQQSSAKSNILLALSSVYDSLDKSTAYFFTATFESKK
jgi:hypothetical protein